MAFEIKVSDLNGKKCFQFSGQIDEEAEFPKMDDMPSHVLVDLKDVKAINSVGIRAWIMWFGGYPQTQFSFLNCPKALVMQMNMVEGFLPVRSEVLSLEVPFFCEDCDKEKDVLFEVGKEISIEAGQVKLNFDKSTICDSGCDPELDVNELKYFRFLLEKASEQAA